MRIRMNEAITEESVWLSDDGTLQQVPLADALRIAKSRSMDLVEVWEWPRRRPEHAVVCHLLRIQRPLVWEDTTGGSARRAGDPELDPDLWFETSHCKGHHYLLGNGHTFEGRLHAWCPSKKVSFRVSKSEIGDCSRETTYFLKGFLTGQEPAPPVDDDDDLLPPDDPEYRAWVHATELFRETGSWNTRFRTCEVCGARLLPANPKPTCWHEHRADQAR